MDIFGTLFFCIPQRVCCSLDYCAPDFSHPTPKAKAINRKENKNKPQEVGKVCNEERKKEKRGREGEAYSQALVTLIPDSTTILPCPSA